MSASPLFFKFRLSEYRKFFSEILHLCAQNSQAALQVQDSIDALHASVRALEDSIPAKKVDKSVVLLMHLDARRDQAIISLRKFADAYIYHYDLRLQRAARMLLHCIDKYGSRIYCMTSPEKTTALSSLSAECSRGAIMNAVITTLGVDGLVSELARTNGQYHAHYINQEEEVDSISDIRLINSVQQVVINFRVLIENMEALEEIEPGIPLVKFHSDIENLINQYNAAVEQRGGRIDEITDEPDAAA